MLKKELTSKAKSKSAKNSKLQEKDRENQEIKDTKEANLQIVIDQAKIMCPLCMIPIGTMKVNYDTPTTQDKKTATVKEKNALSLQFSGNCLKSPNQALPCKTVMNLAEWENQGTILVQDQKVLLKKSTIKCNYGGTTISFLNSGQINSPKNPIRDNKKIISSKWINSEGETVKNASLEDTLSLLISTANYKEGETITLQLTPSNFSGNQEAKTVSGKVSKNGTVFIKDAITIQST